MIISMSRYLLRVSIISLLLLPILIPFLERRVDKQPPTSLTVWVDSTLPLTNTDEDRARSKLKNQLSLSDEIQISFRVWGSPTQTPLEDHNDLIAQISSSNGAQIIVGRANLWGPAARHFREELGQISSLNSRQILFMNPEELGWKTQTDKPMRFIALSELSAPQLNFLGENTQISLDLVGRLDPGEKQSFEVVVRSGESLLASKSVSILADQDGIVNTVQNIGIHFTRAQQQLLTAELTTDLSPVPLNMASTPVSVVHSKTTILQVGVGPDWSLRNVRTKLKFWPNLDLLSYYILREVTDDLSIPSNQLSLIEFPAEKLFGEQLPNFHGVLAQNFAFDTYLNAPDSQHLYDYVNLNGGRLVVQAGPLSFLARDSNIRELMPCENIPQFDFQKEYRWQSGKSRLMAEPQFEAAVNMIVSRQTALGCKPKPGALVLAETSDESRSPMIIAYPVGKGLVLAFMAGDWHSFATQAEPTNATQRAHRVYSLNASEQLFQWMVEFLQRRQDSGLRPPQFAGPRIYRQDPLHAVRSKGGMPEKAMLRGKGDSFASAMASPVWLPYLELEAIRWERTAVSANISSGPLNAFVPPPDMARGPRFEAAGLSWQMADSNLPIAASAHSPKPLVWPVLEGTTRLREAIPNPILYPPELQKSSAAFSSAFTKIENLKEYRIIPILEAYPWLMALALALLAMEQLLGRLHRPSGSLLPASARKSQQKGNG